MSGGADYFTHRDANDELDLFESEVPIERAGYVTDLLTERAVISSRAACAPVLSEPALHRAALALGRPR